MGNMEDRHDEMYFPDSKPKPLGESEHKDKIRCICKICGKKGGLGTGFFCKIEYQNELVPVLITNYHVIDDEFVESNNSLKVYIRKDDKKEEDKKHKNGKNLKKNFYNIKNEKI